MKRITLPRALARPHIKRTPSLARKGHLFPDLVLLHECSY